MNSKYTRLDLHKVTDEEGTAMDKTGSYQQEADPMTRYITSVIVP